MKIDYAVPDSVVNAVDGADFDVKRVSTAGLVGESGCGKITVARALTRLIPKNASIAGGSAYFDGKDLLALSQRQINRLRWRDIAFIPQSAMNSLDPRSTPSETQLGEVLRQRGDLKISSDNRAYDPETVPAAERDDKVIVHGRVFWAGGPLASR